MVCRVLRGVRLTGSRSLRGARAPLERCRGRRERSASGFALLEVVVAVAFLCTVLVAIGSVLGTQMLSVTSSTTWKVASDLVNQAVEEVRALPDSTLAAGLSDLITCDSGVPGGTSPDPNISASGSTWTFVPNGETIPHGDLPCTGSQPAQIPPIIPHRSVTTLNNVPFTVAVYPTLPTGMPSGILRVTAIVSWKRVGLLGLDHVTAQTLVYPTTCTASGNNAYAGPCQPLISAGAAANDGGSIRVTGTVAGVTFDQLFSVLPRADSSMQIQQVSTVTGCAVTSGSQSIISAVAGTPTGESKACSSADNDPGSSSTWQTKSSGSQAGLSLSLTGLLNNLGVNISAGDTATSTSTVAAAATAPSGDSTCTDLGGNVQATGLPCGISSVSNGGSISLSAGLVSSLLGSLGSATLLSASSIGAPASAFVGRFTASGSSTSYCHSPSTTSGDGCVRAGATRSFGLLELAGLPSNLLSGVLGLAPTGWGTGSASCPSGNYLVALSSYSDTVSAESGIDSAQPSASSSGSPVLCYWNGSGYSALSALLGSTSPSLPINNGSFSFTNLLGTVSVSINTSLFLGTATTLSSPNPWTANTSSGCWQAPCTAEATISSPIVGSFSLAVTAEGVQLANITVQIDLGQASASTSYQAAPPQ